MSMRRCSLLCNSALRIGRNLGHRFLHVGRLVTPWSPVVSQSGPYGHCARTAPDMPGAIAVNALLRLGGYLPLKQIGF
jgi:hypothetical protein